MRHKLTFAAAAILLCLLTGCGKEEEATGPVFGDDCRGYDGFIYLEEVTLENGQESMTIFLPKGQPLSPGREGRENGCDGVSVRIGLTGHPSDSLLPESQCREWVLAKCRTDKTMYADSFRIAAARHLENGAVRIPVSYYQIYEKRLKVDRTYYIRQLDQNTVFFLEVNVSRQDITERTAEILKEMEQFYQFEIECDKRYLQMIRRMAQRRQRPGPYLRIRRIYTETESGKYPDIPADIGKEKDMFRSLTGDEIDLPHGRGWKICHEGDFFLAAIRIRKWNMYRKYQIYLSFGRSAAWLVEVGKRV